jgi:hypothetical protein
VISVIPRTTVLIHFSLLQCSTISRWCSAQPFLAIVNSTIFCYSELSHFSYNAQLFYDFISHFTTDILGGRNKNFQQNVNSILGQWGTSSEKLNHSIHFDCSLLSWQEQGSSKHWNLSGSTLELSIISCTCALSARRSHKRTVRSSIAERKLSFSEHSEIETTLEKTERISILCWH